MEKSKRLDPRVLRTRRLLRDAFVECLEEMDLEKITVNRIAERATINRVTFYLHYRDIPDMLEKMADEMMAEMKQILKSSPKRESHTEDGTPVMIDLLEHMAEHAKFYKLILGTKRIPIFAERLMMLLAELMNEKLEREGSDSFIVKAGIQKDIALWYGASAIIGTIVSWLRNDMPYTPLFLSKQLSLLIPFR
ncbi:TetR-like C-terminal domain-containing protein [Marinicrinis lubricantis]|uniref:TetR-like C-terminal domain-containing protein n=1 Tax=Marinicrinis lubricantis TaxID=2086470 RepID=A0ABW1IQY8_9BACL